MTLISLDERRVRVRAHRQAIREAEQHLHEIGDALFNHALQIALAGPLYEWNESLPVGAFADIDAVLADVRDGRVVALLQLRASIATAVEHLKGPA